MALKIWSAIAILPLCACRAEQAANDPANEPAASPVESGANRPRVHVAKRQSQFSSIDPASCRLLEENLEEGGWWRRLCKGAAGYQLELSESDLRQDIVVIAPGRRQGELGLSDIVAKGAFNGLGKTAEWRGADPAKPETLIVRLNVASGPEGNLPDISRLVVVRLKATACIVAIVPPGPDQNEKARAIADGTLPDCLAR
jgi:hypothetical protein